MMSAADQPRIAVVTINEIENSAVYQAFDVHSRQASTVDRSIGALAFEVTEFSWEGARIEHLWMKNSGNVTAALVTQRYFQRPDAHKYDAIILYGCAGGNPALRGMPIERGQVVLVNKVDYCENGIVKTITTSQNSFDITLIKIEKLAINRHELAGRNHRLLVEALGLAEVRAFASEKVQEFDSDLAVEEPEVIAGNNLRTYRQVLATGYEVIEMESFGFLSGLAPGAQQHSACVLRVITDFLGDHAATNVKAEQAKLLLEAARKVLLPAVRLLISKHSASETDQVARRVSEINEGQPPERALPRASARKVARGSHQSARRTTARKAAGRRLEASEPAGWAELVAEAVQSFTSQPGDHVVSRLLDAAEGAVSALPPEADVSALSGPIAQSILDLATARRLGYGTRRLGQTPFPVALGDLRGPVVDPSIQRADQAAMRRAWKEMMSQLDPTRDAQSYLRAADLLTAELERPAVASLVHDSLGRFGVALILADPTYRIGLKPRVGGMFPPNCEISLHWDGFESNAAVLRRVRGKVAFQDDSS